MPTYQVVSLANWLLSFIINLYNGVIKRITVAFVSLLFDDDDLVLHQLIFHHLLLPTYILGFGKKLILFEAP
jgi:hypothetical protein